MNTYEDIHTLTDNADNFDAGDGNDLVNGLGGIDSTLMGGDGHDMINGGAGVNDKIQGGAGDDYLDGDEDGGLVEGGDGDDIIIMSGGNMYGDAGADVFRLLETPTSGYNLFSVRDFEMGVDVIDLRRDASLSIEDLSISQDGDDVLVSWAPGNAYDFANIRMHDMTVADVQNNADDVFQFARHREVDDGGRYRGDALSGDTISGGKGGDLITGGAGRDEIYGGGGDDFIDGNWAGDDIYGGAGDDRIKGDTGKDDIYGGEGDDMLQGGAGKDRIEGGEGDDYLTGNGGRDTFVFDAATDFGRDEITDFKLNKDKMEFSGVTGFSDLDVASFGDDAIIQVANQGQVILYGVEETDITEDLFIF